MSKLSYTKVQIKELESNKYVKKCTTKQIRFTNEFKIELLKLVNTWKFYRNVFKILWFPEYVIMSKVPGRSYTRWKDLLKNKWLDWLIWAKKWRPIKEIQVVSKMTLEEQVEYFKAENSYLKELHKVAYWEYP